MQPLPVALIAAMLLLAATPLGAQDSAVSSFTGVEAARAFYAKFGFRPTGVTPFPAQSKLKQPVHLVVMSKPLA